MVNYFIHYVYTKGEGHGDANVGIAAPSSLSSIEKIRSLELQLAKQHGHDTVCICSFQRFDADMQVV